MSEPGRGHVCVDEEDIKRLSRHRELELPKAFGPKYPKLLNSVEMITSWSTDPASVVDRYI